jgi:hypothetical protein
MDTIRLGDDGSKPARRRDPNVSLFAHDTPTTPRQDRRDRTPPVDWTGQHYKSPADALASGIDYDHVGRTSSAIERINRRNGSNR